MATDYRPTVFLPRTDFPMKAELPKREPELIARWDKMALFKRLREASRGRPKFILHDGPPYANGNIHIGTALNKILKDVVNRAQQMLGKDANYVPGWDCHGLPIEWKIEEQYRAAGKSKDAVPIAELRRECRAFAEKWIEVQKREFRRLGVEGDWDHPYTTMSYDAEAQIAREIGKFLMNGGLYKGAKPVLWSVVEKTALADAEVEYHDHKSKTVWVRFPIIKTPAKAPSKTRAKALARALARALDGAAAVIWTTTPWTIPGNRAIAYGDDFAYAVIEVAAVADGSRARVGERLVVAKVLLAGIAKETGILQYMVVGEFAGSALAGTVCRHPLRGKGYEFDVPLFAGSHVTLDAGSGLVHIAPGAGEADFELGARHGLDPAQTVAEDGSFYPDVPLFAGTRVYTPEGKPGDADEAVIRALDAAGCLLGRGTLVHSYPHSWRSKAPLIFRNTPQWFISMTANELRRKALAAIDATRFVPPQGQARLHSMIESRPDWCISRQRAWGVPIAVFVHKKTGEPLRDAAVLERVADAFEKEGAEAWFSSPPSRFLGNAYDPGDYEQVTDIVDVWFESGCTHSFVLEKRRELGWPASLYLEGSDQHRGWFHSSLLESCGTRGRAPYDAVLTHGFVVDEQGRKMAKSLGNATAPQEVVDRYGADILRLWVVWSDYSEDLRIGPEILKHLSEIYRRLRNTLRYLLGNLAGFDPRERVEAAAMPELERWVLHRLAELDGRVRRSIEDFDFHALFTELHNFCAVDLSAFYFDVRKDALYCDAALSPRRRAARTVLDAVFSCLTAWLAPVLCFTAEEAWLARADLRDHDSVHLRTLPDLPADWLDPALAAKWDRIRALRRVVTGALEIERAEKRIGASLQAHPTVYASADYVAAMKGVDLAELAITSAATLIEGAAPEGAFALAEVPAVGVVSGLAEGRKCERCWMVLPEVGRHPDHPGLCDRCHCVVTGLGRAG